MRRTIALRMIASGAVAAVAVAACTGRDDSEPVATGAAAATQPPALTTTTHTTPTTEPLDRSSGPVAAPVRNPMTARSVYFVMTDRFDNGDPSNDTGGIAGGPLDHGFDPTRRGYHHGGDLAGLTARLPYLDGLGIGAIWITSPFTNRWVQGDGTVDRSSSSYHGYWNIDFDHIDPHLGTEREMEAFITAAHELDIAVIFDIVVNHTGDVIRYEEDSSVYRGSGAAPFRDADGDPFDPAELAGSPDFPALDPAISFPYTPTFDEPSDATAKSPAWLNDVTLYHNRGDSTFSGESETWGDFFGLDDVFTEHPRVVAGMIELYTGILERYDIDGFRVDTMKHVNIEFWEEFAPAVRARAAELGRPDFLIFGEVFNEDPIQQSSFVNVGVSSTLDFIVNGGLGRYVADRGPGALLAQAFDDDDWFTDADGNASLQVTFFGNHDEGRGGYRVAVANGGADDARLVAQMRLANDLLFTSRGIPVVYYGDEQGFTGTGGDQLARQDMFPTLTDEYADDGSIGTDATPAADNFDPTHPLYEHIASLNRLRRDHPAFVTGAQYVHEVDGPIFAMSRIDRDARIEYVVVTNSNPSLSVPARIATLTPEAEFADVRTPGVVYTSDTAGEIVVDVPPLGSVILRARSPVPILDDAPTVRIVRPADGLEIPTPRYRIQAELGDRRYAEVTFAASVDGGEPIILGVDDAPPYRVYWDNTAVAAGIPIEIVATVADGSGRLRSDVVSVTLGDRGR